jgi:hypothetical protein
VTADIDIFRRAGVDAERDEQARQAVLEGRKLVSTLTSYARALTKDPSVLVEIATRDNGSTNGKKIFWRPPMALGDRSPHQRSLCNRRDENLQQRCSACAKREDVLAVIYHEIAHICFDSFQEVAEEDKINLIADAIEASDGKFAEAIKRRIQAAPSWTRNSYIGMANLISEYSPMIVNALEDARVNRELFRVRKGTKSMFDALCAKTFADGVEQLDVYGNPTVIQWRDYPLNAQAIVGLFCKASGYTYESWFRPEVVEALNDSELTGLVNQLATVRSAQGVYRLAFPILARLRELGFCKLPDDPEDEEENDESEDTSEPQPSDDSSGDEDDSEPGDPDSESGAGEEPDSSEPESDPESGDSTEADEAGDSSGEGPSEGPASDQSGAESEGDSGEAPSDSEEDVSDDESGDPGSMGEPSSSEEMDDGSEDQSRGPVTVVLTAVLARPDVILLAKRTPMSPTDDAESHRGTGDISDDFEGGSLTGASRP